MCEGMHECQHVLECLSECLSEAMRECKHVQTRRGRKPNTCMPAVLRRTCKVFADLFTNVWHSGMTCTASLPVTCTASLPVMPPKTWARAQTRCCSADLKQTAAHS